MAENHNPAEEEPVCKTWSRLVEVVLGLFLLVGTGFMAHYYAPPAPLALPVSPKTAPASSHQDELRQSELRQNELQQNELRQLSRDVDELKQEQAMPALVLNRYRNSICYIFGVYRVSMPGKRPALRARISGTGFIVADGLLATNRHVAQPWYGDAEADALILKGAKPELEKLVAFFPGFPLPVNITPLVLSAHGDLAVLRVENSVAISQLRPLPLAAQASNPGELVAVVGYPMGVLGMVAKSPPAVYERLAFRRDDIGAANELAALSLIRPSATCGHLGDVVGDKLIYDAPTAHGGSGGPVFNSQGEVIGINEAYIDGFSGGTLGVSVQALRPLIAAAQKRQ
ncbi:MAG TPA: serine protease [Terriglobales bacterium]|jgi:S1-C subfamily serine protease|nr:serine protease [Terriglobales bacterium]